MNRHRVLPAGCVLLGGLALVACVPGPPPPPPDVVAPKVTLEKPANGATIEDSTPQLKGKAGNARGDAGIVTIKIFPGPDLSLAPVQEISVGRTGASWAAEAAPLTDGIYTARARQFDAAGNTGRSSANTFTINASGPPSDHTAPAAPSIPNLHSSSDTGSLSNDNVTNDSTPRFTGSAEPGSLVTVFDGVTPVGSDIANGGGNYSATTSLLGDGPHTITATATDAATNVSTPSGALIVSIDTAPPAAPSAPDLDANSDTGVSDADDLTTDTTPTFSGTAEAGATVKLLDGAIEVGSGVATGGTYNITTSGLSDGPHTITAIATDLAGNASAASAPLVVTVGAAPSDTTPPDPPSTPNLDAASDSGLNTDDVTNVTMPTFFGTAEPDSTVTLLEGATVLGTGTATGGNYSIATSVLSGGPHTITATATDAAINTSAASGSITVTIDAGAPAAPSTPNLAPASDGGLNTDDITNVTTPTFTGTAETGTTVKLFDGATEVGSGVATGGNYSIATSTLSDGPHTITATATDTAGNVSAPSTGLLVTIDAGTPDPPSPPALDAASDSGLNTDDITNVTAPTFSGTAEVGTTVKLFDGATEVGSGVATGGNYSIATSVLSVGPHTITATATDAATNTSAASGGIVVTIDTGAPAAPSTPNLDAASDSGLNTDDITNGTTPTFSGTAEAGTTVTLLEGSTPVGTGVATGGNYSITTSTLTDGDHTITATATDTAGNVSAASGSITVTIDAGTPDPPSTPDLTDASDSGLNTDDITNVTTPTFTGTAEPGSTVTLVEGATVLGTDTATGGNYSITSSVLSDGDHTITATATDTAGNVSAPSTGLLVTIDAADPAAPSTPDLDATGDSGALTDDDITNVTTPTFSGTAEDGATVRLIEGSTVVGTGVATGGNYSITTSTLTDGDHTISATATDTAGNVSAIHPWECGLDTTPPWMRELRRMRSPWWMSLALRLRLARLVRFVRRDTRFAPAAERPSDDDGLRMLVLANRARRHGFELRDMPQRDSVQIEDLAFNSILVVANQALVQLASEINQSIDADMSERFGRTEVALEGLWEESSGQYYSRNAVTGALLRIPTVATFLPLWSGVPSTARADRLVALLQEPSFGPTFPVPSVPTDAAQFDADRYWKGPTWVNMNWAIIQGLRVYGETSLADDLRDRTLDLVDGSGFAEYFSPLTGQGFGAHEFSWTAALAIDLIDSRPGPRPAP